MYTPVDACVRTACRLLLLAVVSTHGQRHTIIRNLGVWNAQLATKPRRQTFPLHPCMHVNTSRNKYISFYRYTNALDPRVDGLLTSAVPRDHPHASFSSLFSNKIDPFLVTSNSTILPSSLLFESKQSWL